GKWGHHLWLLVLEELEKLKQKGPFAENMRQFPRWPNLKHFNQVTTVHFTDGQSFYDILKCILPSIVQLLPRNSTLIHCIRAYQCYRITVGMEIQKVTNEYGKSFDFFKQHAASHVVRDIGDKGTTNHGSTRPGESFQQKAHNTYTHT
ncbi:hypothetical protein B0H14DRAFT_2163033, partial [Mycena olivaceomarginata]